MASGPDDYIKFMLNQPRFDAEDVLSQASTADTFVTAAGDVDEDTAAFKRFERDALGRRNEDHGPETMQQAKAEPKSDIKPGVDSGKAKKESRMKRDSRQGA